MKVMKTTCFLSLLFLLNACSFSSTERIVTLKKPDLEINSKFGITFPNEIRYQFYQKYGFTDVVEQLVLVAKSRPTIDVPTNFIDLKELQWINIDKFKNGEPIDMNFETELQSDVLIEGKKFDAKTEKELVFGRGKCFAYKTEKEEAVFVFDGVSGLIYIESIKKE